MDLSKIIENLKGCPCGKVHTAATEVVEIGSGLTAKVGEILTKASFPKEILAVADCNTVKASEGIFESLAGAGFKVKKLIYEDMKYARVEQVREVEALSKDIGGIISIGTGSLNDICRVVSFRQKKDFCIFATAPSMDGFASDTAPIVENNFKTSWQAEQPRIIIADTKVLAKAPVELKAAGFGDMVAKYLGILEWRIANILIDEYYCDAVANITLDAVAKMVALADKVTADDEAAAGAIMEALVLSGLAMKLAGCSRPASGAEHVVSHYLECYKLARGIWPEFHGKKVGVATLILNKIYRNLAERVESVHATADKTDWDKVYAAFDASQVDDVKKLNTPTITDKVDPARLEAKWPEIRELIFKSLPETEALEKMMKIAGCATTPEEVHVSPELLENGLRYHTYMRYRLLIPRLFPMLDLDIMDFAD
jgi:glycerol-1-phosphate dehydrogenase [NAD(P)+]